MILGGGGGNTLVVRPLRKPEEYICEPSLNGFVVNAITFSLHSFQVNCLHL